MLSVVQKIQQSRGYGYTVVTWQQIHVTRGFEKEGYCNDSK